MIKWLLTMAGIRRYDSPGCSLGHHGEVLTGLGAMGDAELCLRCGYETYLGISRCDSRRHVIVPDDWPEIEDARTKINGVKHGWE